MDWIIFLAIGAIITALVEVYTRIWRPWKEKQIRRKKEVYRPLHEIIESLIFQVEHYHAPELSSRWTEVKGKMEDLKFAKEFENRMKKYRDYFITARDFIESKLYKITWQYANSLSEEFDKFRESRLAYVLNEVLMLDILDGENIALSRLRDTKPKLYKKIIGCKHHDQIDKVLRIANKMKEDWIVKEFGKERQSLLNYLGEWKSMFEEVL